MSAQPAAHGPTRGNRRIWLLALVTLLVWVPALLLGAGLAVASITGCDVHEGFAQACHTWAGDIGGMLYTLTMMGWFMLITLPFMLVTSLLWLALAVFWLWRRFR